MVPFKYIHNAGDMPKWRSSPAYHKITQFILQVNNSIKGKKLSDSPSSDSLLSEQLSILFSWLETCVDGCPPLELSHNQRYGNPAFRSLFNRFELEADAKIQSLVSTLCPKPTEEDKAELRSYLLGSFGNPVRLDYGTGHELSFLAFLIVLCELSPPIDLTVVGLGIIDSYLRFVRKLQTTYSLEPAGSHGVWGLDDYQFIPFVWGSSQFIQSASSEKEQPIIPASSVDANTVSEYASEYLYLSAIQYTMGIKQGVPFSQHSPLLYDLARTVPTWEKINSGLIRMYSDEVLHKFPIVQHFLFGSHLPFHS